MKLRRGFFCTSIALLLATASGAEETAPGKAVQSQPSKPAPAARRGKPPVSACYTSDRLCAGHSYITNEGGAPITCSVFFDNGRYGRIDFALQPLQTIDTYVRYGDTYACVPGILKAPSDEAPRSWIWVD